VTWGVRAPVSIVVRLGLLAGVVGLLAAFSCSGVVSDWRPGRRRRADDGTKGGRGAVEQVPPVYRSEQSSLDALFSPDERRDLEAAFTAAETEELASLQERASDAALRLRTSAVPVNDVCSTGAGHRAETLRVCFADGTTVVLCCRGSSGSYWVQALRRQILSGSVVLERMTFGIAGPVVVFATPAGEVFVMADLVTIGS
jgi:hypothetical protein